jgi:hypothetical protein
MHLTNLLAFLASVALQIVMLTLLPLTRGYTRLWPTLAALETEDVDMPSTRTQPRGFGTRARIC